MMIKDWKKEIFTIPNLLSLFRLILIPVYVAIYLNATESVHYTIAGTILAVSCLTDMIDGKIARHFNMTSTVGQVLDPIADKATQFTLMVSLAIEHPVLWIVAGFFVLKESFQLISGFVFYRKGKMLTGALMSGKICPTVLFLTLILMVLFPGLNGSAITVFAVIDGLFMMIAFVDYAQSYIRQTPIIQDIDKT